MAVKISELTPAEHVYDGCCFPIVQYDETMKVEYQTLAKQVQTDLGLKTEKLSTTKVDTGLRTTDGRTIWRIVVNGTVGTIKDLLDALNVEMIVQFSGFALSDWGSWWPIPSLYNEAGYNIYFFKTYNANTFGLTFGSYYAATNPVYIIMDYTELPAVALANENAYKGV